MMGLSANCWHLPQHEGAKGGCGKWNSTGVYNNAMTRVCKSNDVCKLNEVMSWNCLQSACVRVFAISV